MLKTTQLYTIEDDYSARVFNYDYDYDYDLIQGKGDAFKPAQYIAI